MTSYRKNYVFYNKYLYVVDVVNAAVEVRGAVVLAEGDCGHGEAPLAQAPPANQ